MVIGGLIGYWVPYWIFGLLSGVAPYILALLVIGAAVYCMMKLNKSVSDTHIPSQTDYDNLRRQADMYMVCEAFGTTSRTFGNQNIDPSVVFDRSKSVAQGARSTVRKAAWGMILVTAITLVIGVSLMKSVDNFEAVDDYTTTPIETLAELTDEWTGTFHGREATMNLTYDGTSLYGTVTIQYSTPMVQAVTGKMETPGNLVLTVDDNPNAQYVGYASLKGDAVEYSGVYTNTAKGTQHDFIFSQPN